MKNNWRVASEELPLKIDGTDHSKHVLCFENGNDVPVVAYYCYKAMLWYVSHSKLYICVTKWKYIDRVKRESNPVDSILGGHTAYVKDTFSLQDLRFAFEDILKKEKQNGDVLKRALELFDQINIAITLDVIEGKTDRHVNSVIDYILRLAHDRNKAKIGIYFDRWRCLVDQLSMAKVRARRKARSRESFHEC